MRTRTLVAVAALSMIAVSCGGLNDAGSGTDGDGSATIDHPSGADELVMRVEYQGGFVSYDYALTRLPTWSLYGDNALITEGPLIEIYPQPAMPNLLVTRLSEDGVQAVLAAAENAGLMDGDATYPYPCITDMPDTVFTVNAGGTRSVVSAYALGSGQDGACPDVDEHARAELYDFQQQLGDLQGWLPEGSVGAEEPYGTSEVRIHVLPYQGDPEPAQTPIDWPLATPLKAFGEPVPGQAEGGRCGVVSGDDLATLMPDLQAANQLTPWRSDGSEYQLLLRPLLPDEHGC